MKSPNICEVIESKINEVMDKTNKRVSIFEADPLDSELLILDWILYHVCKDQQRTLINNL